MNSTSSEPVVTVKTKATLTLYRIALVPTRNQYRMALVPTRNQYRIGLLFTRKDRDFGTISVAERSWAQPILKLGRHRFLPFFVIV